MITLVTVLLSEIILCDPESVKAFCLDLWGPDRQWQRGCSLYLLSIPSTDCLVMLGLFGGSLVLGGTTILAYRNKTHYCSFFCLILWKSNNIKVWQPNQQNCIWASSSCLTVCSLSEQLSYIWLLRWTINVLDKRSPQIRHTSSNW